jgi:predicted CXXCH cytochrome family protein
METCLKCHGDVMSGKFKHGPADAGYCNLCHDPHASPYAAWTRKSTWDLCTTCHDDFVGDRHVIVGVGSKSHPTKNRRDPVRPGKRLTCASCHNPHSAENPNMFAYQIKNRADLCSTCHRK